MPDVAKVITSQLDNLGNGNVTIENEMTPVSQIWLVTDGFSETIANMTVKATMTAAIRAKTLFILPVLDSYEVTGDDKTYTSTLGNEKILEKAMLKYALKYDVSLDVFQRLQTYDKADLRVLFIHKNKIRFFNDGGTAKGFSTLNINVSGYQEVSADGAAPGLSMVTITLAEPSEMNVNGKYVEPTWKPSSLKPLTDVQIAITGAFTSTGGQVTVKSATGLYDSAGAPTYTMIKGIPLADFSNLKTGGTANTISSYTDNADGTYDLVGTGWTTGTINLKAPSAMAGTELLIESISTPVAYSI